METHSLQEDSYLLFILDLFIHRLIYTNPSVNIFSLQGYGKKL